MNKNEELFIGDNVALEKSHFNRYLPVKFLIHGWTDSKDASWMIEMREGIYFILSSTSYIHLHLIVQFSLLHVIFKLVFEILT